MRILMHKLYLPLGLFLRVNLLIIFFAYPSSYASTEFTFTANKKIEAVIATGELNRIQVTNGEIMEVIGDENKYALYWSGDWRNLFIKPKVEVGETIELSLITACGKAQDIRFTVGDVASQTIFINMDNNSTPGVSSTSSSFDQLADWQLKLEISSIMRAMIDGIKGKYYVINAKRILLKTGQQLITQEKAYRYKELSGAVLSIKNLASQPLVLLESDFKKLFKNCIAINLGATVVKEGELAQVFIITREARHD